MGPAQVLALAFALADNDGSLMLPREVEFPFDDETLLQPGESRGGKLWRSHGLPAGGAQVPLAIFVHGIIFDGLRHHWLTVDPDGPWDARPFLDDMVDHGEIAPLAVAVPSQTRDATDPGKLFEHLDFDAFVAAVDKELAPHQRVDRSRIVVVGHSGSACDGEKGAFNALNARTFQPYVLFSIDGCMTAGNADLLASTTHARHVVVSYQESIWPRDFEDFRDHFSRIVTAHGLGAERLLDKLEVYGENPHLQIVEVTLRRWLPKLLPAHRASENATEMTWSTRDVTHPLGSLFPAR